MPIEWFYRRLAALARQPRVMLAALPLLAAVTVLGAVTARPRIPQPIQFNHRKHTQDLALACELCHQYVRTGAHPGLPALETCAMCHQAQLGTTREAARVTELVTEGRPVSFAKLFRLPPHVFYTHRRHVGIANLECANCHGAIALTTRPPRRPLVTISMSGCLDCHRRMGQTQDCVACHR